MSMSHSPWAAMRSLTRDGEVAKRKLAPGTIPRIVQFARPYRRQIAVFLVLVVLDALLVVALPLLFKVIVDELSPGGGRDRSVVVAVALGVAGLAVVDAGLTLWQRYLSSQVGEGLIYDLRTRVFSHVQRMPVAFFTRTQTGALVSRLNTDVVGAQQAFTSTLSSVVVQRHRAGPRARHDVLALVADHPRRTRADPAVPAAGPLGRAAAAGHHPGGDAAQRRHGHPDDRALQRVRRAAGQAVRPAARRVGRASPARPARCATSASSRRCTAGCSSPASPWSPRWPPPSSTASAASSSIDGAITLGTLVALTALLGRLYGPLTALSNVQVDVMTALVSFERVFEVLDLPPMIAEKPGRRWCCRAAPVDGRVARRVVPLPERRRGVARLARVGRRPRPGAQPAGAGRRVVRRPGRAR